MRFSPTEGASIICEIFAFLSDLEFPIPDLSKRIGLPIAPAQIIIFLLHLIFLDKPFPYCISTPIAVFSCNKILLTKALEIISRFLLVNTSSK